MLHIIFIQDVKKRKEKIKMNSFLTSCVYVCVCVCVRAYVYVYLVSICIFGSSVHNFVNVLISIEQCSINKEQFLKCIMVKKQVYISIIYRYSHLL